MPQYLTLPQFDQRARQAAQIPKPPPRGRGGVVSVHMRWAYAPLAAFDHKHKWYVS